MALCHLRFGTEPVPYFYAIFDEGRKGKDAIEI